MLGRENRIDNGSLTIEISELTLVPPKEGARGCLRNFNPSRSDTIIANYQLSIRPA